MREILETCIELDREAYEVYRALAEVCSSPDLATVFRQMALEEKAHVDWWSDLLLAWESGLVPDIADEHEILGRLREIRREVERATPEDFRTLSCDQMIDLAAHLEFFMLDSAFGELVDLMEPGGRVEKRDSYARHVLRLIDAIELYYSADGMAHLLAGVLRRAYRDQQRLAALAMRDQLTGLHNRRALLGHLGQWLSWSARYDRPLGVAVIDVDYFKRINDDFGHATGDEALRAVSAALRSTIRTSDIVGRFGGDEFLVIAPESDGGELELLMKRLVQSVAETPLTAAGTPMILSVSVGGAWVPGKVQTSAEDLIARADESLYAAKAAGRNRSGAPVRAEAETVS